MRRYCKSLSILLIMIISFGFMLSVPLTTNAASQGTLDFVTRCYEIALGREPEASGLEEWGRKLTDGEACGVSVAYGFVYSPEFQSNGYDNATYTEKMYNMLLGRDSDSEGKKYWVDRLNNGESREDIFYGFSNSQEFYNLCESYGIFAGHYVYGIGMERNADINSFVNRFYEVCLGRRGDIGGQGDWVEKLAAGTYTGTVTAYGFIFSNEYIGKNTSNEEYVKTLYETFLGREADSEGLKGWATALNEGTKSREEVFNGFAGSIEFDALCQRYGIVRGEGVEGNTYTPVVPTTEPTTVPTTTPSTTSTPTNVPTNVPTNTGAPTVTPTTTTTTTTTPTKAPTVTPTTVPSGAVTPTSVPTSTPTTEPTPTPKPTLQVGDTITMGSWALNYGDSPKPMTWKVIDVAEGKAMVIAEEPVIQQVIKFDSEGIVTYYEPWIFDGVEYDCYNVTDFRWDTNFIRNWLNEDFYNQAFNEEEQKLILTSEVDNSIICTEKDEKMVLTESDMIPTTEDKIYLLSAEEYNRCVFGNAPTEYNNDDNTSRYPKYWDCFATRTTLYFPHPKYPDYSFLFVEYDEDLNKLMLLTPTYVGSMFPAMWIEN